MKKNVTLCLLLLGSVFYVLGQKKITATIESSPTVRTINFQSTNLPQKISLQFHNTDPLNDQKSIINYTAIRIGEYYWMNNNFNHRCPLRYIQWNNPQVPEDKKIGSHGWMIGVETQNTGNRKTLLDQNHLNIYLDKIFIERDLYQVNMDDFEKYYGIHYSRMSMSYMDIYGRMYENNMINTSWGLPFNEDFEQLIGMCEARSNGIITIHDIMYDLGAKEGENPLCFNTASRQYPGYKIYWFGKTNTNKHEFSMMPGGARLNGDGPWCNNVGPNNGCWDDGKYGDIYHLFYTCKYPTRKKTSDGYDYDYLDINDWYFFNERGWHWMNIRWCRKLTDEELGYRLFINQEQTDIKKLALNQSPPQGYTELPKGLLRGLYVQHILDKSNPTKSIAEIVEIAKRTTYFHQNRVIQPHNPTDIDIENQISSSLLVYPNPTDEILTIEHNEPVHSVDVFNMENRLVGKFRDISRTINIGHLNAGFYTLIVRTSTKVDAIKIIKR